MDAQDGETFINHLAQYIRKHERHLANSLIYPNRRPLTAPGPSSSQTTSNSTSNNPFSSLNAYLGIGSSNITPAKLFLTPNQLYYLLARFEELGVDVGPCNIRLENIHARPTSTNYVSFLTETPRPKGRRSFDQESIQSVSSIRSVMSSVWSNIGASLTGSADAKRERYKAAQREDIRYLYSAFTKIPTLKLAMDHRIRKIADYEEFPFDMAVPVFVYKNLTHLEIMDCDYRTFYGWDRLADQLRSLTLKRAGLEDVNNLLTHIVLDDLEQRRYRSSKSITTPIAYPSLSPRVKQAELARPTTSGSLERSKSTDASQAEIARSTSPTTRHLVRSKTAASSSPSKASPGRRGSYYSHSMQRNTSTSSNGSSGGDTPRGSSSNLPSFGQLPPMKWRFLRHLSLPENGLTSISADSLKPVLSTLQSLDLSSNLFTEIPDSLGALVSLRALNMSNCMVDSLRSLAKAPLPAIAVLNLRANRISSMSGIETLVSLERLDLRDNRIKDPTELVRLTGMPEFREVFLVRNPFTKSYPGYRVQTWNAFRDVSGFTHDIVIDGAGPGYNERKQLNERRPELPPTGTSEDGTTDEVLVVHVAAKADSLPSVPPETSMNGTAAQKQSVVREGPPRRRSKKTPKRRLVEISHEDEMSQPAVPALERLAVSDESKPQPTDPEWQTNKPLPELPREKPSPDVQKNWPDNEALPIAQLANKQTDRTKARESKTLIRQEDYDSDWLNAMGDADAAVNARRVHQEGSIKSGEGMVSPKFAPIGAGASIGTATH